MKTNIGHVEAAAGASALAKVALSSSTARFRRFSISSSSTRSSSRCRSPSACRRHSSHGPASGRSPLGWRHLPGLQRHECACRDRGAAQLQRLCSAARPMKPTGLSLLCLSARTRGGPRGAGESVRTHLERDGAQAFADVCFTTNAGRAHFSRTARRRRVDGSGRERAPGGVPLRAPRTRCAALRQTSEARLPVHGTGIAVRRHGPAALRDRAGRFGTRCDRCAEVLAALAALSLARRALLGRHAGRSEPALRWTMLRSRSPRCSPSSGPCRSCGDRGE